MKKKGIIVGLFSGITWALYTVGLYTVLNLYAGDLGSLDSKTGILLILLTTLTISVIDSSFTLVSELFVIKQEKNFKVFMNTFFSKVSFGIIPAAILAGPFGLLPYAIASYNSVAIAGAVSALYPVVGAVAASIFLKEKITKMKALGIVFAVVGTVAIYLLGSPTGASLIAYGFALVCAFGWGLEAIFGAKLMKADIDPKVTIAMRHAYSILIYILLIVIIVPLVGQQGYILNLVSQFQMNLSIPLFASINTPFMVWLIFILASIIGAMSYMAWYIAMKYIGVASAMVLNISYGLWIVVITLLPPFNFGAEPSIIIGAVLIFMGSLLVIISEKDHPDAMANQEISIGGE